MWRVTAPDDWKQDRIGSARAGTDVTGPAEAACRALDPAFRRMNYKILGNTDAYLHAHLFPRYEWEPEDRRAHPVWLYDHDKLYSAEHALGPQHDDLRARIVQELEDRAR